MKLKFLYLLLVLTLSSLKYLSSQELMVVDFKEAPLDVSAREQQVLDVNNEPCGLLKVRTGLNGVNFSANLAIEKIESGSGEYWMWVSPGTSILRFAVRDFPLLEYKLPRIVEGNKVYVILLTANFPDQVIYRDTSSLQQFVSFNSDPPGAEVFVEDIFYGKTPLRASMPDSLFNYRISKKKYNEVTGSHTLKGPVNSISIDLVSDPYYKRLYLLPMGGLNAAMAPLWGLQVGIAGRTGFYGSFVSSFMNAVPDLVYKLDRDWVTPMVETKNYYYEGTYGGGDRINMIRINGGINQQISRGVFLSGGLGYSSREYFAELHKRQYTEESNYLPNSLNFETAYGLITDYSYKGINFNIGISFRIKGHFLVAYSNTFNIKLDSYQYMMTDFNLGTGYCF